MKCFLLALLIALLTPLSVSFESNSAAGQLPGPNREDKESQFIKPESIQGCYELGVLEWQPDLKLGGDAAFITPPKQIQILAQRGTSGFEKDEYLVRPAPGVSPSVHGASYWKPTGAKTIKIAWTTGFSGLTMQLRVEGETLQGKAETFWDFGRERQTAHVSARKIDCRKK